MIKASYRLDGLEPDNLLAFLALFGLVRALECADRALPNDERLHPRAAWDVDTPPLRPQLFVAQDVTREALTAQMAIGLESLAATHDFGGRRSLDYSRQECRTLLAQEAKAASIATRQYVDLLAALMSDGAVKDDKKEPIDPTPFCLLFGQGHQFFLDRLTKVPNDPVPPTRARGRTSLAAAECLAEALFEPWHREDSTFSFRWDPEEDIRYALIAGDPTDAAYKTGTQHGANRLAAVGITALTLVPEARLGRVRPNVVGGQFDQYGFSFAWPIWRDPATLPAIRAMLAHRDLRRPGGLAYLGVEHVMVSRRISVGKFMNFSRARPLNGSRRAS